MRIAREALEAIVDHARGAAPCECCGILMAASEDDPLVREALLAENAAQGDPRAEYAMGHRAHLEAISQEAAGQGVIAGYYHSHPRGSAAPSRQDEEQALEGVQYLIVGLAGGEPQCAVWGCVGQRLAQEPLEVVDGISHE